MLVHILVDNRPASSISTRKRNPRKTICCSGPRKILGNPHGIDIVSCNKWSLDYNEVEQLLCLIRPAIFVPIYFDTRSSLLKWLQVAACYISLWSIKLIKIIFQIQFLPLRKDIVSPLQRPVLLMDELSVRSENRMTLCGENSDFWTRKQIMYPARHCAFNS
jgi:hypothetical protein